MTTTLVIVLFTALGLLFLDAMRHVALAWKAYFGWQMSLDRADRALPRQSSATFVRLRHMTETPVEGAPTAVRVGYRHNMRWFLAEAGIFIAVCFIVAFTG
jgi:hypothetical protein